MPASVVSLEKLQLGIETTAGTLVAADVVIPVETGGQFEPGIERVHLDEAQGVRAMVRHLDVMKGSRLTYRHALDYSNPLYALNCGLKKVEPTGLGPYVWTINPDPAVVEALDSGTFEISYTDGTTRHLQREFGFATCESFTISIDANQPAMFEATWFGRKSQTSTFTASQSPLTVSKIPSNLFTVYIDPAWADLGSTVKSTLVRTATVTVNTGRAADYTLAGRADLDMTQLQSGEDITGTISLTCEYDAAGDTEYDNWEAGEDAIRFIELRATNGTDIFEIQMAVRLTGVSFSNADGLRMIDLTGELVYDETSTEQINIVITNGLASI